MTFTGLSSTFIPCAFVVSTLIPSSLNAFAAGPPAVPPPLAWTGVPLYDPILGPKPAAEECLTDGGDTKNPLGIRIAHNGQTDRFLIAAEVGLPTLISRAIWGRASAFPPDVAAPSMSGATSIGTPSATIR